MSGVHGPGSRRYADIAKEAAAPIFNQDTDVPGMPRPIAEHPTLGWRPVPWTQDVLDRGRDEYLPSWGVLEEDRADLASRNSLCLLCGQPVESGQVYVDEQHPAKTYSYNDLGMVIDGAPLHDQCSKQTAAHCPHIKEGLRSMGEFKVMPYHQ